ncbi:MAG: DUF2066 domain-containing protein [Pontibacterium sp.]
MDSIRVTLLVFLGLFSTLSSAGVAENLYSSEQRVAEQHGQPGTQQIRQGLSDVLVKVAGNRSILSLPVVLERTRNAKHMLQQFGYRAAAQAVLPEGGGAEEAYILTLDFDPQAVNQLLAEAGKRPLGELRPSLVVWLAEQRQGARDYSLPDGYIYEQVKTAANKRGLPIRTPLLDLTDQRALPLSDLWGLFDGSVRAASARYGADALLAGRLIQTASGSWHYEWLLIEGDQQQRYSARGALKSQIPEMIEKTADKLFAALQGTGFSYRMEGLEVRISNVSSLSDYIDIVDYLQSIPAVTAVHTGSVSGSVLLLTIELEGNLEQFEHALSLQPHLTLTEAAGESLMGLTLNYRWQK